MWIQRTRYSGQYAGQVSKWHVFAGFQDRLVMTTVCKKGGFRVTDGILIKGKQPEDNVCAECVAAPERPLPRGTFGEPYDKLLSVNQIGDDLYQLIYTHPLPNYPNRKHRWDRYD